MGSGLNSVVLVAMTHEDNAVPYAEVADSKRWWPVPVLCLSIVAAGL